MAAHFAIHHHIETPAYYDINIDRGDRVAIFRIEQFDMLAFLDGTEVYAELIDNSGTEPVPLDEPVNCERGTVRLFDSGSCIIERWDPPVYILQLAGRQFYGTLHILKATEGYSLRYVRNREKRRAIR